MNIDDKIDKQEAVAMITEFSKDLSQSQVNFKRDLLAKIKDIQSEISQTLSSFVLESDLRDLVDKKAD
jgi:hypothetical protein